MLTGSTMGGVTGKTKENSSATEAVFSKDGQVKKRINNYETTVVETSSDNVLVFPPKKSEKNDFDISMVIESVEAIESDSNTTKKKHFSQSSALIGLVIILTFSWSIYSIFFSVKPDALATAPISSFEAAGNDANQLVSLKHFADQLTNNSAWQDQDINGFLRQWNQLSEDESRKVVSTAWYQLFAFNVEKQIKQLQASGEKSFGGNQSLLTLGLVLGVDKADTTKPASGKSKYNQLLAELTKELERADKRSKKVNQNKESEFSLNEQLKEKLTVAKAETKLVEPTNAVVNKPIQISKGEINAVIDSYKRAYEKGDMKAMAKLFGTSDKGAASYKQLSANFETTFRNTSKRSMNFYSLNWESSGDTAMVSTKFNSSVDFKKGKGTQFTVADIRMQLHKNNGQLRISRLDVLNRNVNVVSNKQSNVKTASKAKNESVDHQVAFPTAAELQDITTQLVTSYETGDLNQFVSLMSSEIKTNDRIDLAGVKSDYSQLFSTTSDRQMFIQNLKWDNENIGAKGTGDLEVIILSDEGNTVYSMEGKIQIVAQKIGQKVRITHLYHIEREK